MKRNREFFARHAPPWSAKTLEAQSHCGEKGFYGKGKRVSKLRDEHFRRKTEMKRKTFETMVRLVVEKESERKKLPGRPSKLSYYDVILCNFVLHSQKTNTVEVEHLEFILARK